MLEEYVFGFGSKIEKIGSFLRTSVNKFGKVIGSSAVSGGSSDIPT